MTCCTPRLCGCPVKINDSSAKVPSVVESDPPATEMCVAYFFNPNTERMEEHLVPCNGGLDERPE